MEFLLEGMVGGRYYRRTLGAGRYVVGRAAESQVHLVDRSVSREHAVLHLTDSSFVVEDRGSRNGTFVNDQRIEGTREVGIHDRIRFGAIELTLLSPEASMPSGTGIGTPRIRTGDDDSDLAKTHISLDDLQVPATGQAALFQAMTEAAPLLVQPKPLEEIFQAVLDLVAKVIPSRRTLILLRDTEDDSLRLEASRPSGREQEELMMSQKMLRTVLEDRNALLVTDAQADERFQAQESIVAFDVRSALVAPLFDNEQVIGLIYADHDDPFVRYDQDQLRAFTLLANLMAIKITQTKLIEEQREKERLAEEMATASRIQIGLLPKSTPDLLEYSLFAKQRSCYETAGDLYDVALLGDGSLVLVVGDVSGKGLGAALLMSNIMAGLRVLYEESSDLARLVSRLNDQLHGSTEATRFATLFVGRLDPRTHRLTYVSAGHNPPFLVLPDGEHRELAATGIPVGMMPGVPYSTAEVEIPENALLAVFTDGIPEAFLEGDDEEKVFYDEARMLESIRRRISDPVEAIGKGILDDLFEFLGATEPGDDITLLLLGRWRNRDPERTRPS
ncbi:MAG: SpoIIE family protein phosphatase [Candidatus Eisenbacteria bacterium]